MVIIRYLERDNDEVFKFDLSKSSFFEKLISFLSALSP